MADPSKASASDRGPATATGGRAWGLIRRVLVPPAIAYLVLVVLMMFLERALIFFPMPYPGGDWSPGGTEFEEAFFTAADSTRLHGWYAHRDDPVAVILFAHGNAGNVTHRSDVLRLLRRQGAAILVFDYRGYGRSEGRPSEQGVLDDARAARAWLAERSGVAPERIVLMGESLGAAVVVHLAAEAGARGLILEGAFTSLPDVAAYHYPWLPVRWLMRTRLDAAARIGDYHGPLFQMHGEADSIIPLRLGRELFEAANEPKRFVALPGHDHNDPPGLEYYDILGGFLESLP